MNFDEVTEISSFKLMLVKKGQFCLIFDLELNVIVYNVLQFQYSSVVVA